MTYDYHIVLGVIAAIIGICSYPLYLRDILKGLSKPHVFSWFVWFLLTGITFLIQLSEGGGAGSIVAGIESLCCLTIAVLAYTRGEREITRSDWACFVLALIAVVLWQLADAPLLAVVMLIVADTLALIPTLRKSYLRPHQETASQYALSSFHWIIAIIALESFAPANWLVPAWMCFFDAVLVALLLIRRRQLDL